MGLINRIKQAASHWLEQTEGKVHVVVMGCGVSRRVGKKRLDWGSVRGSEGMYMRFWPPSRPVVKTKISGSWAHHTEEVGMRY